MLNSDGDLVLVLTGDHAAFVAMLLKSGVNITDTMRYDNPDLIAFRTASEEVQTAMFADRPELDEAQAALWDRLKQPIFRLKTFGASSRRARRHMRTEEEKAARMEESKRSAILRSQKAALKAQALTPTAEEACHASLVAARSFLNAALDTTAAPETEEAATT